MGLPVWRAPSPLQSATKDATKHDVTAPSRSPIRRRGPWQHRPHQQFSRRSRPRSGHRAVDYEAWSLALDEMNLRATLPLTPPSPPPVPELYAPQGLRRDSADPPMTEQPSQQQRTHRDASAADANPFSQPWMPWLQAEPAPYTVDFAPARSGHPRPLEPLLEWPALRYSNDWTLPGHRNAGGEETAERSASRHADDRAGSRTSSSTRVPRLLRTSRVRSNGTPERESPYASQWDALAAEFNGLGDRQRSFSPDDDNDHWDTMLSTIAPDTQLPTADSSFTSAAASASFSNSAGNTRSNSAASSRTHITIPSPVAENAIRPCVSSEGSGSGSDTEPDDLEVPFPRLSRGPHLYRRHGLLRNPHRLDSPPVRASSPSIVELSRRRRHDLSTRQEPIYPISAEREGPVPPRPQTQPQPQSRPRSQSSLLNQPDDVAARAARETRAVADMVTRNYAAYQSELREAEQRRERRRRLRRQLLGSGSGDGGVADRQQPDDTAASGGGSRADRAGSADDWSISDAAALEPIRAVIDRLAQRDDIPEDWWMSVGLTHSLGARRRS